MHYRRKWRRTPAERRSAAAAALGGLFARRRARGWLGPFLLVSLVLHAPLMLLLRPAQEMDLEGLAREDTYLRKVMQKERAQSVVREVKRAVTMPPPPPDPEAVVSETLTTDIATDIRRAIGDVLDLKVTRELASKVTADLRAELSEAARHIADGALSPDEIRKLQEDFKRKAHRKTVAALRRHREKTQVTHAKLSVKQWYEQRVSETLRGRLGFELFTAGHWSWAQYARSEWGFLNERWFDERLDRLGELVGGQHYAPHSGLGGQPTEHGRRLLPDWPRCTRAQAEALTALLRTIHQKPARHWMPTWEQALPAYLDDFHPHRRKQIEADDGRRIAALWKQVFADAEAYQAAAGKGADAAALASARKRCLASAGALRAAIAKLRVPRPRADELRAVNQALRSRVLRGPRREKVYGEFVNVLLEALAPAIRDMAVNEFREGILIRQKGIDEVSEQFGNEILALVRRDIRKAFPKGQFDERLFESRLNPYRSEVTGKSCPPSAADIRRDEETLSRIVAGWGADQRAYVARRTEVLARQLRKAVGRVTASALSKLIDEGRLAGRSYGCPVSLCFYRGIESVDYTDKAAQRLAARARAMAGRGQDLAELTDEGIPDTSATMVALLLGAAKGHGASLRPAMTSMAPAHVSRRGPASALRPARPRYPPPPAPWARVTQPEVKPPFECHKCEGIPFLANFPRLDGDLTDWGRIRPLRTRRVRWQAGPDEPILIYAAWNYQGFFFGYRVTQPAVKWAYPGTWYRYTERMGVIPQWAPDYHWAYKGDHLRLLFDTLDARGAWRGEPHTQEFVLFPRGTAKHPDIPGIERIIGATRDVQRRQMDGTGRARTRIFPPQPPPAEGPDGTGPYRVTRFEKDGYSTEVFLPRTLFRVPVFCPGWYMGFEAIVGTQKQPRYNCAIHGRIWANHFWHGHGDLGDKDHPRDWGDLLLLGTDPRLAVQNADEAGTLAAAVTPGHSYLLTVIDPDRNVHLTAPDTVVVSAEVIGSTGVRGTGVPPVSRSTGVSPVSRSTGVSPVSRNTGVSPVTGKPRPHNTGETPVLPPPGDMEVFLLKETGVNTSVFRGFVNTQPGWGRRVHAVLECLPGQQVRLGYVDLGNAAGQRNVVYTLNLPVVARVTVPLAQAR